MDEDDLVDRYLRGLIPQTCIEVDLRDPQNLDQAERFALLVDDIRFQRQYPKKSSFNHNYSKPKLSYNPS